MNNFVVYQLSGIGAYVIKKESDSRVFLTTPDSIIISPEVLISLIRLLTLKNLLDSKLLEDIIREKYSP
jgi:hypothetical protein